MESEFRKERPGEDEAGSFEQHVGDITSKEREEEEANNPDRITPEQQKTAEAFKEAFSQIGSILEVLDLADKAMSELTTEGREELRTILEKYRDEMRQLALEYNGDRTRRRTEIYFEAEEGEDPMPPFYEMSAVSSMRSQTEYVKEDIKRLLSENK